MSEVSATNEQQQNSAGMLRVDPQRAHALAENLSGILQRISAVNTASRPVCKRHLSHFSSSEEHSQLAEENAVYLQKLLRLTCLGHGSSYQIRLIAVSKLKPATDILALHQPPAAVNKSSVASKPHYDFGENYAQELTEKAALLPRTIRWHFIGALQTNKCKGLAQDVPNLECVSSVDSEKKANELDKGRARCIESWEEEHGKPTENGAGSSSQGNGKGGTGTETKPDLLNIHVQVNTSGEDSKSGVEPKDATALCRHVLTSCPHLRLRGLMTIGAIARSQAPTTEEEGNEDFNSLREVCDRVSKDLEDLLKQKDIHSLELSMGMSADFEAAIKQGADEIRVGSDIFGERPARKDFKVKEDTAEEKK